MNDQNSPISWTEEELTDIARQSLDGLEHIRHDAKQDLQKGYYTGITKTSLESLCNDPAIARVLATSNITGNDLEIFVCNGTAPVGDIREKVLLGKKLHERRGRVIASQNSIAGRFASYPPGDEFQNFHINEVEHFQSVVVNDLVDSKDTVVKGLDEKIATVSSLRSLIELADQLNEDAWDQEIDSDQPKIFQTGIVRKKRNTVALSNQILSKEQDKLLGLPIDSRVCLLGAPGTGKTTTLVRRLKMKTSSEGLTDDETNTLQTSSIPDLAGNWIFFTPTALLRTYVRNVLDDQNMGQLNRQITTWEDFARTFGVEKLGILKTAKTASGFILKDGAKDQLRKFAPGNQIKLFEEFRLFRDKEFLKKFNTSLQILTASSNEKTKSLAKEFQISTDVSPSVGSIFSLLCKIKDLEPKLIERHKALAETISLDLESFANNIKRTMDVRRWRQLLQNEQLEQDDEGTDEDDDQIEEPIPVKHTILEELKRTIRRFCVTAATSKVVKPESRMGMRFAVLGNALAVDDRTKATGKSILEQRAINKIRRSFNIYMTKITSDYKTFRRQDIDQDKPRWFVSTNFRNNDICQNELDVLILLLLKNLHAAYAHPMMLRRYREEISDMISSYCKALVLVDELTDFSPIQLSAMFYLAHPALKSFFACGDINQRLTSSGIQSEHEIQWAVPNIEIYRLTTTFRQTRVLHDLAERFLAADPDSSKEDSIVDKNLLDDVTCKPKLLENADTLDSVGRWLADSLVEMIPYYEEAFPTVAIFVSDSEKIDRLTSWLNNDDVILDNNLVIEACKDGKTVSEKSKIGIYPISHIKGLEFETVFFIDVDDLASRDDSFLRYLYVGATRSARFFGLTCKGTLPKMLENTRELFGDNW